MAESYKQSQYQTSRFLTRLTNLEALFLGRNGIADISPLAGLTNLKVLYLDVNSIDDLTPLKNLINLRLMRLPYNNIADLSPLVANTGLGEGDEINLSGNPLSYESIRTHIPVLQSRGVTVAFENRVAASLVKTSEDDQQGRPGETLEKPFAR